MPLPIDQFRQVTLGTFRYPTPAGPVEIELVAGSSVGQREMYWNGMRPQVFSANPPSYIANALHSFADEPELVPVTGSFDNAVTAAAAIAAKASHVDLSQPVGIVAAADGARYLTSLVGYRGKLSTDAVVPPMTSAAWNRDHCTEVTVAGLRPELLAVVGADTWVDLRNGGEHKPLPIRQGPIAG